MANAELTVYKWPKGLIFYQSGQFLPIPVTLNSQPLEYTNALPNLSLSQLDSFLTTKAKQYQNDLWDPFRHIRKP